MKKLIASAIAFSFFTLSSFAQSTAVAPAAVAYAKGSDSYLQFNTDTYSAGKKYIVIKFWNGESQPAAEEAAAFESLTKQLSKKGIEVVSKQWKDEAELKNIFETYGLKAEVNDEKRIRITSKDFHVNTTAGKSVVVLEDGKPLSLCSGEGCGERLKKYFRLVSTD